MASCKTMTQVPVPPPVTYLLELDTNEIQFIRDIMAKVGGSPACSRRGIADHLRQVIDNTGVTRSCKGDISGTITVAG